MIIQDITFEVRDINLTRLGVILPEFLNFEYKGLFNNTGTWNLSLPLEHPMAAVLRTAGSGIVVTGPNGKELLSGPTVKPEIQQTPSDIAGTLTVEGITDTVALSDALAYPQPTNGNATTQTVARDERVDFGEALMHQFVSANIGPLAPANRRKPFLVMGENLNRGPSIRKGARFPVLGELVSEIAAVSNLGFQVIQRGDNLVFETYAVVDRSRQIRLDVKNGTLSSQRVAVSAPGATRVIVAGQNEGVDRQFLTADTPASIAAEAAWGRRVERFLDQRQTAVPAELQQAADELLAEEGLTSLTIQAVPSEDSPMRFGVDWNMGDRVSIVTDGQELASVVTGMILRVDAEGLRTGVTIGDATGFSIDSFMQKRLVVAERRLSQLERSDQGGAAPAAESAQSINFTFANASSFWTLPHNFNKPVVNVTCFDSTGAVLIGSVDTTSNPNIAYVEWFYPTAGSALVRT